MWEARAEYSDGTTYETTFPYYEHGNTRLENERQQAIESWLIQRHDGCTWYSVEYVEED